MRAELVNVNYCTVPFFQPRAAVNLSWYDSAHTVKDYPTIEGTTCVTEFFAST